jgi:hypothetical protein
MTKIEDGNRFFGPTLVQALRNPGRAASDLVFSLRR